MHSYTRTAKEHPVESLQSVYIFLISLFTAVIMVPFLRRWALETGAVDLPDERKVHTRAIPRIGGVAICMAWLFSLLACVDMAREVRGMLAGSLIIFFTGFADDLYGLSPRKKFFGQILACLVTITVGGITIHSLGDLFGFGMVAVPPLLAVPFTVVAAVGIVNAFNLMDGLDGLAGGISVIALSAFLVLGYVTGDPQMLALCAALLGGVVGFLKYNVHPARIFMGDTGSLLVGFIIAFLAILLTQSPGARVQPLIPFLILGLPIADTMRVMAGRMLQRKSPFSPDKTHVHHRFLDLGLSHRRSVLIICAFSLTLAACAVLCHSWSGPQLLLAFSGIMIAFYTLIAVLRRCPGAIFTAARQPLNSLRGAPLFRGLSRAAQRTAPVAALLVFVYFLQAAVRCTAISDAGDVAVHLGAILLAGSLALLYYTRDIRNHFLTALLGVSILLITFVLNQGPVPEFFSSLPARNLRDLLHLGLLALVVLHLLFREPGEHFFSNLDYLVIGISAFFLIVSWQLVPGNPLPLSILKGINVYLALKVVMAHQQIPAQMALGSVLAVLLVIVVRGVL